MRSASNTADKTPGCVTWVILPHLRLSRASLPLTILLASRFEICKHELAHGSSNSSSRIHTRPNTDTATMQQARITDNFRQQKSFSSGIRTDRDRKQQKAPELPGVHGEAAVTNCELLFLRAWLQPLCSISQHGRPSLLSKR